MMPENNAPMLSLRAANSAEIKNPVNTFISTPPPIPFDCPLKSGINFLIHPKIVNHIYLCVVVMAVLDHMASPDPVVFHRG